MRIFFSFLVMIFGLGFQLSAQQFNVQLLDKTDKQPVTYANIGILGTETGTNSDDNGNFSLTIEKDQQNRLISISLIGYETYKITVAEFENQLKANSNKLYLQKQVNQLAEVVVRPSKYTFARLGNDVRCDTMEENSLPFPFLFKRKKKGGLTDTLTEIGTLMKVSHKKTFIDSIQINIGYCTYENILYRLNIYEEQDGTFKNILTEPIYIKLNKAQVGRGIKMNLTDKNLVVNNNFIVSIEKVKDLGAGEMSICGKLFGAAMYVRISSHQDNFIKLPMIGMGLNAYVTFSELEK